jgi:hypothetical protein
MEDLRPDNSAAFCMALSRFNCSMPDAGKRGLIGCAHRSGYFHRTATKIPSAWREAGRQPTDDWRAIPEDAFARGYDAGINIEPRMATVLRDPYHPRSAEYMRARKKQILISHTAASR